MTTTPESALMDTRDTRGRIPTRSRGSGENASTGTPGGGTATAFPTRETGASGPGMFLTGGNAGQLMAANPHRIPTAASAKPLPCPTAWSLNERR
jgi:hypothetical protein